MVRVVMHTFICMFVVYFGFMDLLLVVVSKWIACCWFISLVSSEMLTVCYVIVALSCILSGVPFIVYDVRYNWKETGSEEWTGGTSRSRQGTYF